MALLGLVHPVSMKCFSSALFSIFSFLGELKHTLHVIANYQHACPSTKKISWRGSGRNFKFSSILLKWPINEHHCIQTFALNVGKWWPLSEITCLLTLY